MPPIRVVDPAASILPSRWCAAASATSVRGMGQEALPFGTPSEPGADPLEDAIERALLGAGLGAGGAAETQTELGEAPDPTAAEAGDVEGGAADGD